jgi:DNA-binding MarR family transcriptional regulator
METLEKLFGSAAKVKVMRLFIFNPETTYDTKSITLKSRITSGALRRELASLEKIGLIRRRNFQQDGKKKQGWILDQRFSYLKPLESLMTHLGALTHQEIIKKLSKAGRIKFVVVSGVFTKHWEGRVDILIVGDKLNKPLVEKAMKTIESEIGKDLQYATLETVDFKYRLGIGDKLIRDIFDYPHVIIFDRLT